MLAAVGGGWAFVGAVAGCLPVAWLEFAYDQVARRRHRFAGPATCPRLSPHDLAE
jgi:predicted DCC family thiol-disulfide oxidoreductase YuxK